MTVKEISGIAKKIGLSTDDKPTGVTNGSEYDEINVASNTVRKHLTNDNGANWYERTIKAIIGAGSAIIGKVGHDKTGLGDGRKTVTTAGVREHLVAASSPAKLVIIDAIYANAGVLLIGAETVLAAPAIRRGHPMYAGESVALEIADLYDVYLDTTVSGEGCIFVYLT